MTHLKKWKLSKKGVFAEESELYTVALYLHLAFHNEVQFRTNTPLFEYDLVFHADFVRHSSTQVRVQLFAQLPEHWQRLPTAAHV